jgi:phosphoribosyl-ATP pyrophosphohydrolase
MLYKLTEIIKDRKTNPIEGSYTNHLLAEGEDTILKKVGEEAVEVILAAASQGDQRVIEEVSDLMYHLLVLLAARDLSLADIDKELNDRHSEIQKC